MRLLLTVLTLTIVIIGLMGDSQAFAQIICITNPCEEPLENNKGLSIKDRIVFLIQDTLELINPEYRQQFGQNLRESILTELDQGKVIAQEKIDRVEEKLGIDAIRELADINEINKIHEEFIEIERLTDTEEQKIRAVELDSKVNNLQIVIQGCEKPIRTMEILNSDNYYETLRNDFCYTTLKHIDLEQAKDYLGK